MKMVKNKIMVLVLKNSKDDVFGDDQNQQLLYKQKKSREKEMEDPW